jgi:hypothetical protein
MAGIDIPEEIKRADALSVQLLRLIQGKQITTISNRDDLLVAYWSIVVEHNRGILCLLREECRGTALALWRPLLESLVRTCVSLIGSEDEVKKIRTDRYKMNFIRAEWQVAQALKVDPSEFSGYFRGAEKTLHSLTHGGIRQLHGRFDGAILAPRYPNEPICQLVRSGTISVFITTMLVLRHFKLDGDARFAEQLWEEYRQKALARSA